MCHELGAVHDLFPTILDFLDVQPPQSHPVDGKALQGLLTGQQADAPRNAFLMHYPHAPHRSDYFTSYRERDWKVVYHYFPSKVSADSHYQLFNLANDPYEQKNLADSEPQRLRTMMTKLAAQLEAHQAVYPVAKRDGKTPLKPLVP